MILAPNDAMNSVIQPAIRSVPARKANRMRFAWFVVGTAFGAALTYYIVSTLYYNPEFSQNAVDKNYTLLSKIIAPLPALPPAAAPAIVASVASPAPTATHTITTTSPALPANFNVSVRAGDTLMSVLEKKGVGHSEATEVVRSVKKYYDPRKLAIGQSLALRLDKSQDGSANAILAELSIPVSPLKTLTLSRTQEDSFTAKEVKSPVSKEVIRSGGTIQSSLYQTGLDSGVPPQLLGEVINALSYDVDFQRDIKQGDELDVVYERIRNDKNVTAGYGKVLYVSLALNDKTLTLFNHTNSDGYSGYYNARGESVKKALLRTPVDGAHITSGFGMRMHPLLGYSKMHKGVDFGAVTGTPIYAAGDGVVAEAGRKGGYGNYVRINHNNNYATAYGHASRIASGIHAGAHVKQGQIIAYVGATGMATGPHLHYEILVNGAQVNPSGVKFRTGQTLAGKELAQFKHDIARIQTALANTPRNTQLAELER